jgi:hypothetical protein
MGVLNTTRTDPTMRRVVAYLLISLDGVVEAPDQRLFDTDADTDGDRQRLALADARRTTTGAMLLTYRPRPR